MSQYAAGEETSKREEEKRHLLFFFFNLLTTLQRFRAEVCPQQQHEEVPNKAGNHCSPEHSTKIISTIFLHVSFKATLYASKKSLQNDLITNTEKHSKKWTPGKFKQVQKILIKKKTAAKTSMGSVPVLWHNAGSVSTTGNTLGSGWHTQQSGSQHCVCLYQ